MLPKLSIHFLINRLTLILGVSLLSLGFELNAAVPADPTELTTTAVSPSRIDLKWKDNSSNESRFYIYRAPDSAGVPGTFSRITYVGANITSYSNTGLSSGRTYWYKVRAYNGYGYSTYSNKFPATTPLPDTSAPSVPQNLTASNITSSSVMISWSVSTDNVGVYGYRVYRNGNKIADSSLVRFCEPTSYCETALSAPTTYQYQVSAYDLAGNESALSGQLPVTTQTAARPIAPSNLVASEFDGCYAILRWLDNSNNETAFIVEREKVGWGLSFEYYATLGANTSYLKVGPLSGGVDNFRVFAENSSGRSQYSNVVTLDIRKVAVTNLRAYLDSSNRVTLTWNDYGNEKSYIVEARRVNYPSNLEVGEILAANTTTYQTQQSLFNELFRFGVNANLQCGNTAFSYIDVIPSEFRTLNVSFVGSGTGLVSVEALGKRSRRGNFSLQLAKNGVYNLKVTPDLNASFVKWRGAECEGVGSSVCQITMNEDKFITVEFTKLFSLYLRAPIFSDSFDRTDSTSLGPNWVNLFSQIGVLSNRAIGQVLKWSSAKVNNLTVGNTIVSASYDLRGAKCSHCVELFARKNSDQSDQYYAGLAGGDDSIKAFIARQRTAIGKYVDLGAVQQIETGVLHFVVDGGKLELWLGDGLVGTLTDTNPLPSGAAGLSLYYKLTADNFEVRPR